MPAIAFALALALAPIAANPAPKAPKLVTFKVVKAAAAMATAPPELHLLSHAADWKLRAEPTFAGENAREVFFSLEPLRPDAPLPRVAVRAAGIEPLRAIVGKTDVAFERVGDEVRFDLVADGANAMLLNQMVDDPEGGRPIHVYHNWLIRQDGQYRGQPTPAVEVRAVLNYLVAAREALKLLAGPKTYEGELTLMSFEVACARGHNDSPPHVHIMLWVPGYVGGEVPHFYMDAAGKFVSNSFSILGDPENKFPDRAAVLAEKKKRAGVYGPGKPCPLYDLKGRLALEATITDDGRLRLRTAAGEATLAGDPAGGPGQAALVLQNDRPVLRAVVSDDAERGRMTITVDHLAGPRRGQGLEQEVLYDPFTGLKRKADR